MHTRRFFDARAPLYDAEKSHALSVISSHVAEAMGTVIRPDVLLDVAIGSGHVAAVVQGRLRCQVVGVDLSMRMLDLARARPWGSVRPALLCADAERLPLQSRRFSAVLCTSALQYLNAAAISELARVTAPTGRLVLADAHPASEDTQGFLRRLAEVGSPVRMGVLDATSVRALLQACGFELLSVRHTGYRREWRGLEAKAFSAGGQRSVDELRHVRASVSARTRAAYEVDGCSLRIPYAIYVARRLDD